MILNIETHARIQAGGGTKHATIQRKEDAVA
jgi:hypothetical protein